ncbi:MAG: MDR family MFS transporter [Anaerovoracaceae bacterium]
MNDISEKKVSKRNMIIISVMLSGAFIAILNQTVLSPALPSIMRDLNITASEGQWLTTAFMLVNGIMIPITAYFIDRFTTRQIYITSMVIFTVGTTLAGFSHSFTMLMVARIFQAIAAGILMPLIQTVILLIFPKEKRGSAMGTVGIVVAFAPAIGPTLAGSIIDSGGWNLIFKIIAPLSGIVLILAIILLKNVGETRKLKLSISSVVYSTLGFGGLLYGCSCAGAYGILHPLTYVPLAVGIVFLIIFLRKQLIMKNPLLEIKLLKTPTFCYSTIIAMIINASLIAGTIITPIYLQNILGFTAMQSGLVMLPGAVMMGIMSPITGHLFDRFGPRFLTLLGLSLMTAGSFAFILFDENWIFSNLCIVYTIRMFGISMILMPVNTWGLNSLDNKYMAHGSAINNTFRQVAGSIGTALLVTIMTFFTKVASSQGAVSSTLYGMHVAFGVAAGLSAVGLILAILFVKDKKEDIDIFSN